MVDWKIFFFLPIIHITQAIESLGESSAAISRRVKAENSGIPCNAPPAPVINSGNLLKTSPPNAKIGARRGSRPTMKDAYRHENNHWKCDNQVYPWGSAPYGTHQMGSFNSFLPQPDAYIATHFCPAFRDPARAAIWASHYQTLVDRDLRTTVPPPSVSSSCVNHELNLEKSKDTPFTFTYDQLKAALEKV